MPHKGNCCSCHDEDCQENDFLRTALDRVTALADLWHTEAESLSRYIEEHEDDGEHSLRRTVLMMTEAAENELREHLPPRDALGGPGDTAEEERLTEQVKYWKGYAELADNEIKSVRQACDSYKFEVERLRLYQDRLTADLKDAEIDRDMFIRFYREAETKYSNASHALAKLQGDRDTAEEALDEGEEILGELHGELKHLLADHSRHMHRWIDDSCLIDAERIGAILEGRK